MKKIILTAAAVFVLSFANAQDKKASGFGYAKGDFVLGGNIMTMSSTDASGAKTSESKIGPDLAYFISDNLALELGVTLGNTKDAAGVKGTTTNVAVGARYYFLNLGERFKTYTNFGLNFGSDNNKGVGDNTTSFGVGAGIGMNYFLTSRVAINFGLGSIIDYKSTSTGSVNTNSMEINLNEFNNFFSQPTFGVSYKF